MLKTKQIGQFCNVKKKVYLQKNMIFQGRGRPQGNIDKKDIRLFPKKTRSSFEHNSSSRRSFETLTSAFYSIFQNKKD